MGLYRNAKTYKIAKIHTSIVVINDNKVLTNQKLWCVILSRHRKSFTAIVHDRDKLQGYLMKNDGNEMSAIELVQKVSKWYSRGKYRGGFGKGL